MEEYPCIICLLPLPTRMPSPGEPDKLEGWVAAADADDPLFPAPAEDKAEAAAEADDDEDDYYDGTNAVACLPCGHTLHNRCLRLWINQANSCPTCRGIFHEVSVSHTLKGPVVSRYSVADKTQPVVADAFDDSFILSADDFEDDHEDETPCLVCDFGGREDELLLCDSCDAPYHASCLGMDGVPAEAWYCPSCVDNHAVTPEIMRRANTRRQRRTQRSNFEGRLVRATTHMQWDNAWQLVWDRLNRDLDEPAGDLDENYMPAEDDGFDAAAEEHTWAMRLRIAQRSAYQATSPAHFMSAPAPEPPLPAESAETREAWHMLGRALEIQEQGSESPADSAPATPATPARSRPGWMTSATPDSDAAADRPKREADDDAEAVRKFKRPRAAQRRRDSDIAAAPETSAAAAARAPERPPAEEAPAERTEPPSLMKTLLQDIRRPPSGGSTLHDLSAGATSPPASSSHALLAPKHESASPTLAPMSPRLIPLPTPAFSRSPTGSPVLVPVSGFPVAAPAGVYYPPSPASPTARARSPGAPGAPVARSGPPRDDRHALSLSEKTEIQELVRGQLRPLYHRGNMSKDEYTEINMRVSRSLYGLVASENRERPETVRSQLAGLVKAHINRELQRIRDRRTTRAGSPAGSPAGSAGSPGASPAGSPGASPAGSPVASPGASPPTRLPAMSPPP
ncbi:uncharacterized protein V1510DRAFT_391157 [Dipodascopsis tothii]|uniref:uncharacterized protein n=1 Tax=Dipodascopsis tothii TaxID=44089 RepID=UPI0034CF166C